MRTTIVISRVIIMVGKRNDLSPEAVNSIREKLCKFSKKQRQEICKKYKTMSATSISKIYNVCAPAIHTALKMEGVSIRTKKEAQQMYLKHNDERSIKQSEFMKINNPMNNSEHRKKCSQPGELNGNWTGGNVKITCDNCGKIRYLKKSSHRKLILNGMCWNCYKKLQPKSSIEISVAEELTRRGINFKEQVLYHRMFLDFLLPNKIVIECDGEYWHTIPENEKRDRKKDALLKKEGYTLIRLTEKEIKSDVESCVENVLR